MSSPRARFAFEMVAFTCSSNVNFSSRMTPRSLIEVTFSSVVPLMLYDESIGFLFKVILNDLHFDAFSFNLQSAAQRATGSRSFCRAMTSLEFGCDNLRKNFHVITERQTVCENSFDAS